MSAKSDLEIIARQERELVFSEFNEDIAFALGSHVRESSRSFGRGIAVGVYLWDRTMFYGATAGANAGNQGWVERKAKLTRMQMKSSYRMVLERGDKPRLLEENWAIPATEYALAGGAFPLSIAGLGIVGAISTSGLSERDDHNLGVMAVCAALGRDYAELALPAA